MSEMRFVVHLKKNRKKKEPVGPISMAIVYNVNKCIHIELNYLLH